jgi:hypothetical protein
MQPRPDPRRRSFSFRVGAKRAPRSNGEGWIDFQALDWNAARDFYRRLDLEHLEASGCAAAAMLLRSAV